MPDKVCPGPLRGDPAPREAVCIHTKKVYDSCRDKECLDSLRVYLTQSSQCVLDAAINVKPRTAELLWADLDVEPVVFNKGFYTVDVRMFYRVTVDALAGPGRPQYVSGVAVFDKRTVLFGSEGSARIFSSACVSDRFDPQLAERSNLPVAVLEVVDPVILGCKIQEHCPCETPVELPAVVRQCFDEELVLSDTGRTLYATLGQFSILRLEREIQLLMPAYDICMPQKECPGTDDPCALFESFRFPVDEFYPPRRGEMTSAAPAASNGTCGCRSTNR